MATGLTHLKNAMGYLGILASGGTPNAGQQTQGIDILNTMLAGFEAAGMQGWAKTTVVTGKSQTVSVSTSAVVTQTEVGGTVTTTMTPVAVARFASPATDNAYPSGWDEMIDFNLACNLSGPMGGSVPEWVAKRAVETKAALMPTNIQVVTTSTP